MIFLATLALPLHAKDSRLPRGQLRYALIDLGTLGGPNADAQDVNGRCEVVGTAALGPGGPGHAFLYTNGTMQDLGTLGGDNSQGINLNDQGRAVGDVASLNRGFVFIDGQMQPLPMDIAFDINNSGQIVGHVTEPPIGPETQQAPVMAVLYENGTLTPLGKLGGRFSSAHAINERGEIVGGATVAGFAPEHAFLYRNGAMADLGTLGGAGSTANDINERGHVTGIAELPSLEGESRQHAFLYRHHRMIDLGALGSDLISAGQSINNFDQVVGVSFKSGGESFPSRAFIYTHGRMRNLDDLIDPASPLKSHVSLLEATGINDRGCISATGYDSVLGMPRAYLLRPLRWRAL